jgi:hypothetical protein
MQEALTGRVNEETGVLGMVLTVSYDLFEFLYLLGLHVQEIIHCAIVFNVPKIDSQVISREEVLSIRTQANGVDMIFMPISKLCPAF